MIHGHEAGPRPFNQFSTLPTIDGFDVIDTVTGHPVDHRETLKEASGKAYHLNLLAKDGSVAAALGVRR